MKEIVKISIIVLVLISGLWFASKVAQKEKKQQIVNAANKLGVVKANISNSVVSSGGSLLDVYQKAGNCYFIYTFAISEDGKVKYIGKVRKFNILIKK